MGEMIDQAERTLDRGDRLQRVHVGEAGEPGHLLVQARVVLHRARAEREEAEVDGVVLLAEADVMAHRLRLGEARERELEFMKKEQELKSKAEELEIETQRKLTEEREKIKDEARKIEEQRSAQRESEHQMKVRELEKQLEDQKKLAEEMKRRAEQGSMQLQGEVQELALEDLLRTIMRVTGMSITRSIFPAGVSLSTTLGRNWASI